MSLHYQILGEGEPVVLHHGLFGSLSNLALLAKHLVQLGYQVISVDALNHGHSPTSDDMCFATQAKHLAALLDQLGIERCCIVGHSMGGKVAMALALIAPERVKALVVADIAPVAYQHSHQAVFDGLHAVPLADISSRRDAEQYMAQHVQEPGVRQFLLKSLSKEPEGWRWLFRLDELRRCYPQIIGWQVEGRYEGPCLFIKGARSDYIEAKYQPQVAQIFPHASLKIIEQTGHWLHAEKPDIFNRLTERFLHSLN
ncbi:alpha/beta fold hydrolase [Aliagarivorans marinus]|uniref:alpha/beta fold hydrolase n=1 Tax=Aliagarivorans marinus TaxID=561965 RepID=UPI000415C425|nr:alpha/beta fold hydrolase [Aliagarivorans marinus]